MGWLGYTEQQTLDTSIPALLMAIEGHIEMLRAVHGAGEPDKPKSPPAIKRASAESIFAAIRACTE